MMIMLVGIGIVCALPGKWFFGVESRFSGEKGMGSFSGIDPPPFSPPCCGTVDNCGYKEVVVSSVWMFLVGISEYLGFISVKLLK